MMKKIKLFPKIFIYTFSIILFLIILTHIIIYYSFQIIYLENKKEEIKRTANKLSENIADFEKNEIYNSLKLFSKNNDVKVFVKNGNSKDDVRIDENIGINSKSKYNSIIIEEKTVKTKTNDEITLQFIFSKDIEEEAKNISLKFLPYTLLLSFVFSIIISYFYTKIIISPIFEITKVTDNMMKLDRNALLKVNAEDEIGHLKGQINILYTRLLGVIDNLDKKNKEIIKFEKTKVDFLRSTSHELKTPLASLKVILENMIYIAFKGTAGGVEWRDNAYASYPEYAFTEAQREALEYFDKMYEKYVNCNIKKVYVTGHSKGGNKAQFIMVMRGSTEHTKLKKCFSFCG